MRLDETPRDDDRDFSRATAEIARRLASRGIATHDADSPEDVVRIMDAVEVFERAVIAHGGDLMVDEPPRADGGEPDDPHFLLPRRAADESASAYAGRLKAATSAVRRGPRLP